MEDGFFSCANPVNWAKSVRKFRIKEEEGDIPLAKHGVLFLGGARFRASICKSCTLVILDYSEQDAKGATG